MKKKTKMRSNFLQDGLCRVQIPEKHDDGWYYDVDVSQNEGVRRIPLAIK